MMVRARWAVLAFLLGGCVYYNGMYNAKRLAGSARKAERDGRVFEANNLWSQVVIRADSLVTRHPDSKYVDEALVLKGIALARTRQCPAAVAPLGRAFTLPPDAEVVEDATLALGRCQLELGDPKSAEALLARVVETKDKTRRRRSADAAGPRAPPPRQARGGRGGAGRRDRSARGPRADAGPRRRRPPRRGARHGRFRTRETGHAGAVGHRGRRRGAGESRHRHRGGRPRGAVQGRGAGQPRPPVLRRRRAARRCGSGSREGEARGGGPGRTRWRRVGAGRHAAHPARSLPRRRRGRPPAGRGGAR